LICQQIGRVLEYADDNLKANREFMLAAVKQNANTLQYASEALQRDKELRKIAKG